MMEEILKFFVLFFVVVEPITLVPLFAAMTEGADEAFRRRMALKAVCVAGFVLLLFAVGGASFLKVMGISIDAFRIAGGIMLFLIALEMVFARESGTRTTPDELEEGKKRVDVSVFPLAFPFIAGPGALAIVLLTFGASRGDFTLSAGLFGAVIVVLLITYLLMRLTPIVMRVMGVTGGNVVNRLSGVVLAALAVQFIITGVTNAFPERGRPSHGSLLQLRASRLLEVEDAMPEALPAALETRRAALGPVDAASGRRRIREIGRGVQHLEHPGGVRLPVGRELEAAAGLEAARDERRERRLDDPALVVALLRPGIREIEQDFVERGRAELVREHLDGVVRDDADVRKPARLDLEQAMADARRVHFRADEIPLGRARRELDERVAVAEADLEHPGRGTPERTVEVDRSRARTGCRSAAAVRRARASAPP